jgi:hypothetical protein
LGKSAPGGRAAQPARTVATSMTSPKRGADARWAQRFKILVIQRLATVPCRSRLFNDNPLQQAALGGRNQITLASLVGCTARCVFRRTFRLIMRRRPDPASGKSGADPHRHTEGCCSAPVTASIAARAESGSLPRPINYLRCTQHH